MRSTQKALAAARRAISARANVRAADLAPIISDLQAAGITTLRGIAAALTERGIPTAYGRGAWTAEHRSAEYCGGFKGPSDRAEPLADVAAGDLVGAPG
jgi:hypothetical protein